MSGQAIGDKMNKEKADLGRQHICRNEVVRLVAGSAVRGWAAARREGPDLGPARGTFSDWLDTASLSAPAPRPSEQPPTKQLHSSREAAAGVPRSRSVLYWWGAALLGSACSNMCQDSCVTVLKSSRCHDHKTCIQFEGEGASLSEPHDIM